MAPAVHWQKLGSSLHTTVVWVMLVVLLCILLLLQSVLLLLPLVLLSILRLPAQGQLAKYHPVLVCLF